MRLATTTIRWNPAPSSDHALPAVVAGVRAILSVADTALDYATAKLAFDRLIDPASDAATTMALLDAMVAEARRLAGPSASPDARLDALRHLLHVDGPWNDHRSFAYDHDDPLGQNIPAKLLATYLSTRRGNCVSMPALFLILADRLGLDVALATVPLHALVRYRGESGRVFNIETTSGAHPSRDEWYRERMPISDRAIETGLYLRSLTRREGVALLATTVIEHLTQRGRFAEALAVSAEILRHAPRDAHTMAKQGTVCGELIRTEFSERYRRPILIPASLRPRYLMLARRNHAMFAAAEALGWEPID